MKKLLLINYDEKINTHILTIFNQLHEVALMSKIISSILQIKHERN